MTIKAIETRYKGYRFRSRLEARWAVFFDALGLEYQYEPQGFKINGFDHNACGGPWTYLPDFYLPKTKTWVEVKGTLDGLRPDYFEMVAWAIDWGGCLPDLADSDGGTRGLLWLAGIPPIFKSSTPAHVILQHSKGGFCRCCQFDAQEGLLNSNVLECKSESYFDATSGAAGETIKSVLKECIYDTDTWCYLGKPISVKLSQAYHSARSARFEHGECG